MSGGSSPTRRVPRRSAGGCRGSCCGDVPRGARVAPGDVRPGTRRRALLDTRHCGTDPVPGQAAVRGGNAMRSAVHEARRTLDRRRLHPSRAGDRRRPADTGPRAPMRSAPASPCGGPAALRTRRPRPHPSRTGLRTHAVRVSATGTCAGAEHSADRSPSHRSHPSDRARPGRNTMTRATLAPFEHDILDELPLSTATPLRQPALAVAFASVLGLPRRRHDHRRRRARNRSRHRHRH